VYYFISSNWTVADLHTDEKESFLHILNFFFISATYFIYFYHLRTYFSSDLNYQPHAYPTRKNQRFTTGNKEAWKLHTLNNTKNSKGKRYKTAQINRSTRIMLITGQGKDYRRLR
jgi:hypothetical protein